MLCHNAENEKFINIDLLFYNICFVQWNTMEYISKIYKDKYFRLVK